MRSPALPEAEYPALYAGLSGAAIAEVRACASTRVLSAGEYLFLQGESVEALFVIQEGALRMVQHTPEGEEVVIRTLGRGEIVAGVALLGPRTYPVSAMSQVDCRLLAWSRAQIHALAVKYPAIRANILATIADRMQDSLARIRELSTERVGRRVARSLMRLARDHGRSVPGGTLIDKPLGRQELADLSGASMYTASRLLAAWMREGVLDVGRQRVLVRSLDRLEALARGTDDSLT